jgi:hypothetical protein
MLKSWSIAWAGYVVLMGNMIDTYELKVQPESLKEGDHWKQKWI